MGRAEREKGKRWEREVARLFTDALGAPCRRTGFHQAQDASAAPDVDTGGAFWVECKAGRLPNPRAALRQAREAAPREQHAIAVVKDDRQRPFVAMDLEDFLELVGEWAERKRRES